MLLRSSKTAGRSLLIAIAAGLAGPALAASIHIEVAGIDGADPVPGHPNAMTLQTLTIAPNEIDFVKAVDAASPSIELALVQGTPLASAVALFYDAAPPGEPDAVLSFRDLLVSSSQTLIGPGQTLEQDGLVSATPDLVYLELPGISGETSTPGHPGVIALRSFSTDGSSFEVVKAVDSASPAIQLAVVQGTPFSTARLLLYDNSPPGAAPDGTLIFHSVLASSSQSEPGGGDPPLERDGFAFLSVTPEPASGALGLASGCVLSALARRRAIRPGRALRIDSPEIH